MKWLLKGLGLLILLSGLAGVALYFTSDLFRAWVRQPSFMYRCKIERELPDTICLAGVAVKELADGKPWRD